jgi:hypothetical protein
MKSIKDPTRLGGALVWALWAFFAARLLMIGTMGVNLLAYNGWAPDDFSYEALGMAAKVTQWVNLAAQFVAGVLSLVWIHRVSRNANRLAGGLPISPGWAVGWYFVPVGAFWKPFEAVEQAWKASVAPAAWRSVPTPALLRWWWGFWIGAGVLSAVFGVLHRYAGTSQGFDSVMLILVSLLVLGQCVLLARIVRRLGALQAAPLNLEVFD